MQPRVIAALLFVLGVSQMVGDVLGLPAVKGIGAATLIAPAPKVFSSVRGLETFSSEFSLTWEGPRGERGRLELTPEVYARLAGPYNRRNVYGAVLAYGPVLPADLRGPVLRYALCSPAPLVGELGLPAAARRFWIHVSPRSESRVPDDLQLSLELACR